MLDGTIILPLVDVSFGVGAGAFSNDKKKMKNCYTLLLAFTNHTSVYHRFTVKIQQKSYSHLDKRRLMSYNFSNNRIFRWGSSGAKAWQSQHHDFTVWLVLNNETHVLQIAVHGVYFFIFRVQRFRNLNLRYAVFLLILTTNKEKEKKHVFGNQQD